MKNILLWMLLLLASKIQAQVDIFFQNTSVLSGETIEMPIKVKGFNDMLALQFTIQWDANVAEFQEITMLNEAMEMNLDNNFSLLNATSGSINFLWEHAEAIDLSDSSVIFAIQFKAKANNGNSTTVSFTNTPTAIEGVDVNGLVTLNTNSAVFFVGANAVGNLDGGKKTLVVAQNLPNPFNESTQIPFILEVPKTVSIRIYNSLGKIIWSESSFFSGGSHSVNLDNVTFDGSGVYYYRLTTTTQDIIKKMIYSRP